MDIFYKRVQTWHKWPDNDQLDYDMVHFSTGKWKKFEDNVFLKLKPQDYNQQERQVLVALQLNVKPQTIKLIKI